MDTGLSRNFAALAAVAMGGIAGALGRWGVVEVLPEPTAWPWGVFLVNIAGSFVLGLLGSDLVKRRSVPLHLALATGFCGAFTTFSAFAVDVAAFAEDSRWSLALSYTVGSVGAGLLAALVGWRMGTDRQRVPS